MGILIKQLFHSENAITEDELTVQSELKLLFFSFEGNLL